MPEFPFTYQKLAWLQTHPWSWVQQHKPISTRAAITRDPRPPPKEAASTDRNIFVWLKADPKHPINFAIVGPPGSGKTTLMALSAVGAAQ